MKLDDRSCQVAVFVIVGTEYFWRRDASVNEVPTWRRFFH